MTTIGTEFLINTTVSGSQKQPDIAVLSDGRVVAVWSNAHGTDYTSPDISAQIFNADGSKSGAEFKVNMDRGPDLNAATYLQQRPAVAALSNGGFAVIYQDGRATTTSPSLAIRNELVVQRFLSDGSRDGADDTVVGWVQAGGSYTISANNPDIVGLANGGYMVAYETSNKPDALDPFQEDQGIIYQMFNALGVATTGRLQLNTTTQYPQQGVKLAALSNGNIAAVWGHSTNSANGWEPRTQIIDQAGSKVGSESAIIGALMSQSLPPNPPPQVAALDDGRFVVVWDSTSFSPAQTGTNYHFGAQLFNADGTLSGTPIALHATDGITQLHAVVAGQSDGSFLVVGQTGGETDAAQILGQLFDSSGTPNGQPFLIGNPTDPRDTDPEVVALPGGRYFVAWEDDSPKLGNGLDAGLHGAIINTTADTTPPSISAVSIPNAPMKIGSVVTATITVASDADAYTLGAGSTIAGFALGNLTPVNATTLTATFTVTAGSDIAGGSDLPVNLILIDSASNASTPFTTPISQVGDAIDATRPSIQSANVNGTTLVLTYSEALDAAHPPVAGDFAVTANAAPVVVSGVAVDSLAKTVTLTLASAVTAGATVRLSYADTNPGDALAIADLSGNAAVSLLNHLVTNTTADTTPPSISAVSIPDAPMKIGSVVTATITVASDADAYTLGAGSTIAGFALGNLTRVNATTLTATFTVTAGSDIAGGSNLPVNLILIDSASNASTPFTTPISQAGDAIDATRPSIQSASVNGTTLVLTYSEALDAAHPPVAGDFAVTANAAPVVVSGVAVDSLAKTVTLTLASAVAAGATVHLGYADTNPGDALAIADLSGNAAVSLLNHLVTNTTAAPPSGGGGGGGGSAPPPPASPELVGKAISAVLPGLNSPAIDALKQRLADGDITYDELVEGLIQEAQTSTVPALVLSNLLGGATPTQEHLTELTIFAQMQYQAYAAAGVANPALGPYEAIGLGFTETKDFQDNYGKLSVQGFLNKAYGDVFGREATPAQQNHFTAQISYFVALYQGAGMSSGDALLKAKGAVIGQMVGHAVLDEPDRHTYDDAANDFLKAAITGSAGYGDPLGLI